MSFQWTFIAGYLYFEVGIVIFMILPIFSPRRWNQFFNSQIFSLFKRHAAVYFYVLLGVLSLFLIDAIREMKKYSHHTTEARTTIHLSADMKGSVKLFRAQRNFYITGFAIFLAFVIRRLVNMLIIQDELSKKAERIIQQAEDTVMFAKNTVMANQMEYSSIVLEDLKAKLEQAEEMLSVERSRANQLEIELGAWQLKYEKDVGSATPKDE